MTCSTEFLKAQGGSPENVGTASGPGALRASSLYPELTFRTLSTEI